MRNLLWLLPVILLAACASTSRASLIDYGVAADGDGAVTCTYNWDQATQTLTIDGVHRLVDGVMRPGHILSEDNEFTASSVEDPTVTMNNSILNDTGYAWTSYTILYGVKAKNGAALTIPVNSLTAGVTLPVGWTATVNQPLTYTASYLDADGINRLGYYIGSVTYSGPALANGDTLDAGLTASFSGATSYISWQEMTPVPEPATLVLLAAGGLLAMARRRGRKA